PFELGTPQMVDGGHELRRRRPDPLVLRQRQLDRLVALGGAALAHEADEVGGRVGPQALAQLPDALVDLPEDSLILRHHPFPSRGHVTSIGRSAAKGKSYPSTVCFSTML